MPRPLKTLEELREAANIRAKRWQAKQRQAGKKHISATIEPDVFELICRERDRNGTTLACMIETAIKAQYGAPDREEPTPTPKPEEKTPVIDTTLPLFPDMEDSETLSKGMDKTETEKSSDDPPSYHGQELTTGERDSILIELANKYPRQAKANAERLNRAGVATPKGQAWTGKSFSDVSLKAKKRREKRKMV